MKIHLAIFAGKLVCAVAVAWVGYSIMSSALTAFGAAFR